MRKNKLTQEIKMKKQMSEKEIKEMLNVAAQMIVSGMPGLKQILSKKAKEIGNADMMECVKSLIGDYENSNIFKQKKESYHGSAFALYLNLEIAKI